MAIRSKKSLIYFHSRGTITDAHHKYMESFNDRFFLEQLLYIDDLEDEPIQWIGEAVSKEDMRDFSLLTSNK